MSLRFRLFILLGSLMLITLIGGLAMVWYTGQIETLIRQIVEKNIASFETAEALETALINQKGFVSYYFLDNNPNWLKQLGEYRQIFRERLKEVRLIEEDPEQKKGIEQIAAAYEKYIRGKDQVIFYYRSGEWDAGRKLHAEVRRDFFKILELCEAYKSFHKHKIEAVRQRTHLQAKSLRLMAVSAMSAFFVLALILVMVLFFQILRPIRNLAHQANLQGGGQPAADDLTALKQRVHGMIENIDQTHSELEKSRAHLLQAERMALVGKLAAGMAHSIRNPMTSVKMRMFSLNRSLDLTKTQREDFKVISEEIKHIDTIVQNFLEFSRPPKLKIQSISPSEVVDMALQLLKHRLESYNVEIVLQRQQRLPAIQGDPEQLKEVLVNIIVNACEAMASGGQIVVSETKAAEAPIGNAALIRFSDNGPGIPERLRDKIFQPFYTTKEEGTGLGLSIAARIIAEHGGQLRLLAGAIEGTTFEIMLPLKE